MPWQKLVADVGGELVEGPGGLLIPAFREVVFTVPRQNGKTSLVLAWECQRAIGWEHLGPQRISYSAQTGSDARKKLLNDQKPIIDRHMPALGVRRVYEAMGSEGVVWHNGSRLVLLNNTEASGHGPSVDLGVKDELFSDFDSRRDQALIPAMATRAAAQVLACSTMGTDESVPWNALVDRGRLAVEADQRSGIAYFEWSAEDDDDPDDPDTWRRCMPALGFTITEPVVRHAGPGGGLPAGEFLRAFCNRKTRADDRILPVKEWTAVCSDTARPDPVAAFCLDVNPERSAGAIVAASPGVVELVDHRPGVGWLVARATDLDASHGHPLWVVDATASSPASGLIPNLTAAGLRVHPATSHEYIDATGQFFDGVMEGTVAVRRHADMDAAAAAVAKRIVGDSFAWTRKGTADISPLVAATLALWGAGIDAPGPRESDFIVI